MLAGSSRTYRDESAPRWEGQPRHLSMIPPWSGQCFDDQRTRTVKKLRLASRIAAADITALA